MCSLNQEQIAKERSFLLKTFEDILYLKHKALPPPHVEISDYFNIQTSETTLTINATKGGIDQFLEQYGHLKTPPELIDLLPFQNANRIWGSRWVVPAEETFPDDVCPYSAEGIYITGKYSLETLCAVTDSLRIRFVEEPSENVVFCATAPSPEGSYQEFDELYHFEHDFDSIARINNAYPYSCYWIIRPIFRLTHKKEKHYSLPEIRSYLSTYETSETFWDPQVPLEEITDAQITSVLKTIDSVGYSTFFNKVYHPELILNQKGWDQFIELLKILKKKKEWFFVTHLNPGVKDIPYFLTPHFGKENDSFTFKALEFIRPELEEKPCLRMVGHKIGGNCHGLMLFTKWIRDFVKSGETERFILNEWIQIPGVKLKPGCLEKEQWIFLEKFQDNFKEPFLSLERHHKDCLVIWGNDRGFSELINFTEKYTFNGSNKVYDCIWLENKNEIKKLSESNYNRLKKSHFFIFGLCIYGGFKLSPEYEPGAFVFFQKPKPLDQIERLPWESEIQHHLSVQNASEQHEFDGDYIYNFEFSETKARELYFDTKNTFIKERMIQTNG